MILLLLRTLITPAIAATLASDDTGVSSGATVGDTSTVASSLVPSATVIDGDQVKCGIVWNHNRSKSPPTQDGREVPPKPTPTEFMARLEGSPTVK